MRFAELQNRRVLVMGDGAEGRAAVQALQQFVPSASIEVCTEAQGESVECEGVPVRRGPLTDGLLAGFEVIIKSPGVSLYRPEIRHAIARGVRVTSGTNLWFANAPDARTRPVVCITGTKGKSTTTAMTAHALDGCGLRARMAGNIGVPLMQTLVDDAAPPDVWVLELSSYQIADFDASPSLALMTNLSPEHLDWHGTVDRYFRDKFRLLELAPEGGRVVGAPGRVLGHLAEALGGATTPELEGIVPSAEGVRIDGDLVLHASDLRVPGEHNLRNAACAITLAGMLGHDPRRAARSLRSFEGLPHRLRTVLTRGPLRFVDDSLSTTPEATLAAVRSFRAGALILLVGGQDRGVSWDDASPELARLGKRLTVVTMPDSGVRAAESLTSAGAADAGVVLIEARTLDDAVTRAVQRASMLMQEDPGQPVTIVLSPGAPSYHAFRDYRARGEAFLASAVRCTGAPV